MYMREWTPDFDPSTELSSMAHLWVKAYNLPTFYWHPQVLTGLLSVAGKVVKFDGNTMSGTVGQFVRALVEVDMAQPLLDYVRVGCEDSSFLVELVYENLPFFCSSCKIVGHSLDRCHKNPARMEGSDISKKVLEGGISNRQPQAAGKEEWRKKGDKRRSRSPDKRVDFTSQNSFQALDNEDEEPMEPSAMDILEHVTVPMNDVDKSAQPASAQPISRLEAIERRMQAEIVVEQAVRALKSGQGGEGGSQDSGRTQAGLDIVKEKLVQTSNMGAHPTAFEVHTGGASSLEVMNRVARKAWADDLDSEDEEDDYG